MAIPSIPSNFNIQQGNGEVFLSWSIVAGATSYSIQRSTDGVTFSVLNTSAVNSYLDSTATVGTLYYYKVASVNTDGTSSYTNAQSIVPTLTGDLSLGQIRLMAQQRADMVNSNFVKMTEWNTYINQSYFELYDLLTTIYEDYFIHAPYIFQTTGGAQYDLPDDFYKLLGVDCGLANNVNAWATLKKFPFAKRNEYVYPQISTTLLGIFDLRYRVMGNTLYFIPTPASGQFIRVWYVPKMTQLLQDTDILTGISGWSEYVIVDAAIKAMQKEESDVSVLGAQKMMLIKRIEAAGANRDQGMADTIADTRSNIDSMGGNPWNGSFAGY
jgi:fibronectin type 3 domain-containing protein